MKIQTKTIILIFLLMLALIVLLSYFFYNKYKFLLDYIDSRIDLKLEKFNTKYNLENLNEINKIKEQDYINDLKNNIINNNTESFFSKINELSDVEEESLIEDDVSDYDNLYIKEEDIKQENIKEEDIKQENIKEEDIKQENIKEENIKQEDIKVNEITISDIESKEINLNLTDDIPNLESLEDNVDDYIKSILDDNNSEELILDENSVQKKN